MWKYLIFNVVWLSILFAANLFGRKALPVLAIGLIFGLAAGTALKGGMDPLAWSFYVAASFLVFWSSFQFRRWSISRSASLEAELHSLSQRLEAEKEALQQKMEEAEALDQRTGRITYLYDKIKEMSQSLESFETFLIFGEAFYKNFRFENIKLVIFDPEKENSKGPEEVFELRSSDFERVFDRSLFLRDPKKRKAGLFPAEQKIVGLVLEKRSMWADTEWFEAHPVFVDQKISAVLLLAGIHDNDKRMLSLLIGRFLFEIQRVKLYEKIEAIAITDGLTGVYVRRHLLERFEKEVDRSKRFGFKLSFLMMDVDAFKHFNDHYGHLVGDAVLKQVAETIKMNIRELDLVGRYGGEEFGALLIETDASTAFFIAQRIRQAVEERNFKAYDENLKVTISVGCSTYSQKLNSTNLIVDAADSALYQAKKQGRNKVCVSALAEPNHV